MPTDRTGYFPVLKLRRYEIVAIRALLGVFESSPFCWPVMILSPGTKIPQHLEKTLSSGRLSGYLAWDPARFTTEELSPVFTFFPSQTLVPTLVVGRSTTAMQVDAFRRRTGTGPFAVFTDARPTENQLVQTLVDDPNCSRVFVDCVAPPMVFGPIRDRVVHVEQAFEPAKRNRDYPQESEFSPRLLTWQKDGLSGFGDYQVVDPTVEPGIRLAHAVAIHMTYQKDRKAYFVRHFVSDDVEGTENPQGKFLQALGKLMQTQRAERIFVETQGFNLFADCHRRGHFPGLGTSKAYSIEHHIETMEMSVKALFK